MIEINKKQAAELNFFNAKQYNSSYTFRKISENKFEIKNEKGRIVAYFTKTDVLRSSNIKFYLPKRTNLNIY